MLLPGLVWIGLIGGAALYETWAVLRRKMTLSQFIWQLRRRRSWFGLVVGGLLLILALHLLLPMHDAKPKDEDVALPVDGPCFDEECGE